MKLIMKSTKLKAGSLRRQVKIRSLVQNKKESAQITNIKNEKESINIGPINDSIRVYLMRYWIAAKTFENLEELDNILETHFFAKQTQDRENLNSFISIWDTESNLKPPLNEILMYTWFHWWIPQPFKEEIQPI